MTCILFETFASHAAATAEIAATLAAQNALPGATGGWVGCAAPGSINAGELVRRVEFSDEPAYRRWRSDLTTRDGIMAAEMILCRRGIGHGARDGGSVWRGLAFAVTRTAPQAEVTALESALLAMPEHITELRGWRLSRAIESSGSRSWSHLWEQQVDDAAVLRGRYLTDPIHWSHVDGWFDVECPQWIVDPYLIHCFADTGSRIVV